MVLSNIDSNINYIETNGVDKKDFEYESYIYEAEIFKKFIKFVLGKPNFDYIDNNIVYFNIYLVKNENVVCKIGIYETENTVYTTLLDSTGDIILNKLNSPRIFSFAKVFIKNNYDIEKSPDSDFEDSELDKSDYSDIETSDDDDTDDDTDDDYTDDDGDDDDGDDKEIAEPIIIKEQTKEESDSEMQNYEKKPDDKWVNEFLKSYKYGIVDNEGGGDCFFAVLRDGLKTVKINTTVKAIREKLANEVDDVIFNRYKEFFEAYYGGFKNTQDKLKEHKKKHNFLKKMIGGTSDGKNKAKLIEDARSNFSSLSSSSNMSKEYEELVEEFDFMKNVKTIDDLKTVIKSNIYWADVWAVTTLERLYNVKFIILSKTHFQQGEIDNVLQCGEADKKLQEKGLFEPAYYIILDYETGIHYKLVTYDKNNNKGALKFKELPYKIKELVLEKCMEKCAGPFSLIPDFREFANCNNVSMDNADNKFEQLIDTPKSKDYDNSIVIQIYNKSLDKKIGDGSGESIKDELKSKLKTKPNVIALNKMKEWRKKLDDNFIVENLIIEGNEWSSVKHYMLASRFYNLPDVYKKFMRHSEDKYGNNIIAATEFHDKIFKDKSYKSKIIKDEEFKKERSKFLEKALYSKFTQNDEFKQILLLTGDAKINIFKPGKGGGAYEATELMKVRQLLGK
tara:strand:- start:866 stop:2899 length:2034 start_codon:yes stop_codon:yes gene_type:complete